MRVLSVAWLIAVLMGVSGCRVVLSVEMSRCLQWTTIGIVCHFSKQGCVINSSIRRCDIFKGATKSR